MYVPSAVQKLTERSACPAVNLAAELTIVEEGEVVDRWPVAAGRKVQ
jgi:hypothetical protein